MFKKSKQTYFQDGWLSSEELKAWFCKASTKDEAITSKLKQLHRN